jgi:hypothetical protein
MRIVQRIPYFFLQQLREVEHVLIHCKGWQGARILLQFPHQLQAPESLCYRGESPNRCRIEEWYIVEDFVGNQEKICENRGFPWFRRQVQGLRSGDGVEWSVRWMLGCEEFLRAPFGIMGQMRVTIAPRTRLALSNTASSWTSENACNST